MLNVVPPKFDNTVPASFGEMPEPRVVRTMMSKPRPEDTLAALLKANSLDESSATLIETYPSLQRFATKLAGFFTEYYPAQSKSYPNGIAEILDAAVMGFYTPRYANEPRSQIAAFHANGVVCATHVLLSQRVKRTVNGDDVLWEPWSDGQLTDWIKWDGTEVRFDPAFAPPPEVRYATRQLLVPKLLQFNDVVAIAKAGIDMKSADIF